MKRRSCSKSRKRSQGRPDQDASEGLGNIMVSGVAERESEQRWEQEHG